MGTFAGEDTQLRELMRGYQQGRIEAFEELYVLLAGRLRGFLSRHAIDRGRTEDLVQEAFLQLHRARHTYDPAFPLMPWVLAIARHVVLMDVRTARRQPRFAPADAAPEPSVRADADRLADRSAIGAALAELVPSRRSAVVLHHVRGWSFREIAQKLGIEETAAKLRSSRGMAQLRSQLGGPEPPPERGGEARR